MEHPIWGPVRSPFVPQSITDSGCGLRPSIAKLMEHIDTADPAFPAIAEVLTSMVSAGVEIDEAMIQAAVKLGRQRHAMEAAHLPALSSESAATPLRLWPEQEDRESIVYYARRGKLVKIGTTTSPQQRFTDLAPDEILAWEPGGRREEALRHRQFNHLRQAGEYFRTASDLLKHCKALRKLHGHPDPTWRTTAAGRNKRVLPLPGEMPAPASMELVTGTEAARLLGLNRGVIASWQRRGILQPAGVYNKSRPLFFLDHIRYLKSVSPAYRDSA